MKLNNVKRYSTEEIYYEIALRNEVSGYPLIKIAETLSILSKSIVNRIFNEVYFVVITNNIMGGCLPLRSDELKNKKAIIFFPWWIFKPEYDENRVRNIILHELAHYILKHERITNMTAMFKNKMAIPMNEWGKLNTIQVTMTDMYADELVDKWLNKYLKDTNNNIKVE